MLFICKAYGNQFTVDELKDAESGLDAAGIVIEFNMIDMGIAEEMNKRMDKMMKNFRVASDSGNNNHLQHRKSIHQ